MNDITTVEELNRAVESAPEDKLREMVKQMAHLWFVDEDGTLDSDKEVNGGDAVEMISSAMEVIGIWPSVSKSY